MTRLARGSWNARLASSAGSTLSRDKADTLLLLGACMLILAPHALHLPPWATAFCALLLGWRGWLTLRGRQQPARWILLPAAALAVGGVFLTYRTLFGREAGVTMLVLLLAFKLLEMRARRDFFVVVFLGFFLLLTTFFYSQTLPMALLALGGTIGLLTALLSFQYAQAMPGLAQRIGLILRMLALSAPLTLVLFVLFPRIQGPLWGLPNDASGVHTGMSETMSLDNISHLALSQDVAFRVRFSGNPPEQSQLYWRGPVLGDFDGKTWRALRQPRPSRIVVHKHGQPITYQVTMEPSGQRMLFALDLPMAAARLDGNPTRLNAELQMVSERPIAQRVRYEATSLLDYDLQPEQSPQAIHDWLTLPPDGNPRTRALADDIAREQKDVPSRVQAVLRRFREQNFRYTLSPPPLGSQPIDDFLFSTQAGFCEHYASAFVVLMRMMGIPARVVTGYQGGELNPMDGYLTVRQSDAHAWAEVWMPKAGWLRIDPTAAVAPQRVERNLESAIPPQLMGGLITLDANHGTLSAALDRLRQSMDAVTNQWNQWVLDYTPTRQQRLLASLGFPNGDWRTLTLLMVGLGMAVTALVAVPLIRHHIRRDPIKRLYDAFCARLTQHGFRRLPHEGPRAFRDRIFSADLELPEQQRVAIHAFLELYERVLYAAQDDGAQGGLSAHRQRATHLAQLKLLYAHSR